MASLLTGILLARGALDESAAKLSPQNLMVPYDAYPFL